MTPTPKEIVDEVTRRVEAGDDMDAIHVWLMTQWDEVRVGARQSVRDTLDTLTLADFMLGWLSCHSAIHHCRGEVLTT